MKTLAIILIVIRFVYFATVKLAIFMVSLMTIICSVLFTRNMIVVNKEQNRTPRRSVRP